MLTPGAFEDRRRCISVWLCCGSRSSRVRGDCRGFWIVQVTEISDLPRWRRTTSSARSRCARRAACCFDRNGKVLVENENSCTIAIVREQSPTAEPERRRHAARRGRPAPTRRGCATSCSRHRSDAGVPADPGHRARDVRAGRGRDGAQARAAGDRRPAKCRSRAYPEAADSRRTCSATSSEVQEAQLARAEYAGVEPGRDRRPGGHRARLQPMLMGKDGAKLRRRQQPRPRDRRAAATSDPNDGAARCS